MLNLSNLRITDEIKECQEAASCQRSEFVWILLILNYKSKLRPFLDQTALVGLNQDEYKKQPKEIFLWRKAFNSVFIFHHCVFKHFTQH